MRFFSRNSWEDLCNTCEEIQKGPGSTLFNLNLQSLNLVEKSPKLFYLINGHVKKSPQSLVKSSGKIFKKFHWIKFGLNDWIFLWALFTVLLKMSWVKSLEHDLKEFVSALSGKNWKNFSKKQETLLVWIPWVLPKEMYSYIPGKILNLK